MRFYRIFSVIYIKIMDKHTVESAVKLLQFVYKFGFEGLRAFTLTREKEEFLTATDDETYEEVVDRLSSACWTGADYFRMWLGDENIEYTQYTLNWIPDADPITFDNGVYYFELLASESHYWIWIIINDKIWYAGTYGGELKVVVKEFDKNHYSNCFIKAMNGSIKDYEYVFQITETSTNGAAFRSIKYSKSEKYY